MRKKLLLLGLSLIGTMASAQVRYDDFETNGNTVFGAGSKFNYIASSDGAIELNIANPSIGAGNNSATVARWQRPAAGYQSTQLALFQTMTDVSVYASNTPGTPKIKMKTYTNAPIGTEVMITIGSRTNTSYPGGVYTTFVTHTTAQDAWEELTFNWNPGGVYDGAPLDFGPIAPTDCGRFVIQIDGAGANAYDLYFDDVEGPELNAAPTGSIGLYDDFQNNTPNGTEVLFGPASRFGLVAYSEGAIDYNYANPSTVGNPSSKCARWDRPAVQYPNVSFGLRTTITNAYAYASNTAGTPKISMKIYTNAPVGTEVLIRLDSTTTNSSYPNYVYTTFTAVTTVQDAWETITFDWTPSGVNGNAFGNTAAEDCGRFVVILANGLSNAYTLYIDDVMGPATNTCVPAVLAPDFSFVASGLVVDFTSTTTGGTPLAYIWDFDDASASGVGSTSSHTYTQEGDYDVSLTVIEAVCGTSTDIIKTVSVSEPSTGLAGAAAIASSVIYPNPASDEVTLSLSLKASSQVRVTLSDMMGKEVMTLMEGSTSEVAKTFVVSGLQKGVYVVNYIINDRAAKAELLMVK
jgi:PKD repeat protein